MPVVFDIHGGPLDGRFATTGPPPAFGEENRGQSLEEVIAWTLWYSVPPFNFEVGQRFSSFSLAVWQRLVQQNRAEGLGRQHVYEVTEHVQHDGETIIRASYVGLSKKKHK